MMYPQNTPCKNKVDAQVKICYRPAIHPVYLLVAVLLLTATAKVRAENDRHHTTGDFYRLLQKPADNQYRPVYRTLLSQVTNQYSTYANTRPDLLVDQDLAFNYLWMQRYQMENSYREGGAAAGKLFRMGIKALYKVYSGDINFHDKYKDDEIGGAISTMEYRIRVSSDRFKLGVEYKF